MFDENNKYDKLIKPWFDRTQGMFVAGIAIFYFVFVPIEFGDSFLSQILSRIISALMGAITGAFMHLFLFVPIFIISSSLQHASEAKIPFFQGFTFIVAIAGFAIVFDGILLGGTFLFHPLISLIFNGDLNDTFYGCDNWVSVDEGSYCAD